MKWADARLWKTVLSLSDGTLDDELLDTLLHIHEAQHAFLNVWLKQPFRRWKRTDFESIDDMLKWAAAVYAPAREFLETLSSTDLNDTVVLPWETYFEEQIGHPPAQVTLGETIYQTVSHSMHHRGQAARRLHQLGGVPPLTDYIVWLWMDRPDAKWPA